MKSPEKFNRFFINENYKEVAKIREKSSIRSLIEYKIKDYKFTEKEYKNLNETDSALYIRERYIKTEIITRKNKREHILSNKIKIDIITQSKYNTLTRK